MAVKHDRAAGSVVTGDFAEQVIGNLERLVAEGLVERVGDIGYRITEAGRARLRDMPHTADGAGRA